MKHFELLKRTSVIIALIVLVLGFLFLYSYSLEVYSSLSAAILASVLAFVSCEMLRWLYLSFRK